MRSTENRACRADLVDLRARVRQAGLRGRMHDQMPWSQGQYGATVTTGTRELAVTSRTVVCRPGWYEDPTHEAALRYWDGQAWSPYVAELDVAAEEDALRLRHELSAFLDYLGAQGLITRQGVGAPRSGAPEVRAAAGARVAGASRRGDHGASWSCHVHRGGRISPEGPGTVDGGTGASGASPAHVGAASVARDATARSGGSPGTARPDRRGTLSARRW